MEGRERERERERGRERKRGRERVDRKVIELGKNILHILIIQRAEYYGCGMEHYVIQRYCMVINFHGHTVFMVFTDWLGTTTCSLPFI